MSNIESEIMINITPEMRQAMAEHSAIMERVEKKLDERVKLDVGQLRRFKWNIALSLFVLALDVFIVVLLVKR